MGYMSKSKAYILPGLQKSFIDKMPIYLIFLQFSWAVIFSIPDMHEACPWYLYPWVAVCVGGVSIGIRFHSSG